jgi:hypothetical protein
LSSTPVLCRIALWRNRPLRIVAEPAPTRIAPKAEIFDVFPICFITFHDSVWCGRGKRMFCPHAGRQSRSAFRPDCIFIQPRLDAFLDQHLSDLAAGWLVLAIVAQNFLRDLGQSTAAVDRPASDPDASICGSSKIGSSTDSKFNCLPHPARTSQFQFRASMFRDRGQFFFSIELVFQRATIDFLLLGGANHPEPRVINSDKHAAYPPAITVLQAAGDLADNCQHHPYSISIMSWNRIIGRSSVGSTRASISARTGELGVRSPATKRFI